jgi:energy-coupling factor transporter ATP-binding protein EcfA2
MPYIPRFLTYTDTTGEQQTASEADLLTFEGPVVILGEPGMGKSELLRELARIADHADYVTARALMRRPDRSGLSNRTLIIDALDELAAAEEHDPVQNVLAKLAALGSPPFVLSCRAADWRSVAKQDILEDYGVEPREYRLNPLTEVEATAFLAASRGDQRATELVSELDVRGLSEFYGNPLTLQLIDRIADDEEGLPSSRAKLFLRASDMLRSEHNTKRIHAPLSALASDDALNAAGAACAALILTSSEAIEVGARGALAGDLHVSEIAALPGAGNVRTVLGSNLFLRREGSDRFGPFHRALAEFLGARWLATCLPSTSMRRVLGLLVVDGGVPASLRGLHAWIAHFSPEAAADVMAVDPYGVLRYGDAVDLSPTSARALLNGLKELAEHDPWFRSEDWMRHAAPGITQAALAPDLLHLLMSPGANFHLKSLVLGAMPRSEAGRLLDAELMAIFEARTDHPYTFHERAAAFDVLVEQRPRDGWANVFGELASRPGEDDRRLVVEGICDVGSQWLPPDLIARAALAYLGLLPETCVSQNHVDTFGPLHLLARDLSGDKAGLVLDAMVAIAPDTEGLSWECRYALSSLLDDLLSGAINNKPPEPLRLTRWLGLMRDRDHHENDRRQQVRIYIATNDHVRRAIQHHLIVEQNEPPDVGERIWSIGDYHHALRCNDDDYASLLKSGTFSAEPSDDRVEDIWRTLVRHAASSRGLSKHVHDAAMVFASDNADRKAFIAEIDRIQIPPWRREQAARRAFRRYMRRRKNERVRRRFAEHEAEMRSGDWAWLYEPATAYLNRYSDLDRDVSPKDRLEAWLGGELADAAITGFEFLLLKPDLPSAEEMSQSYSEGRRWNAVIPMLAAACHRVAVGDGFDVLPEPVVIAVAVGEMHEHIAEEAGGKALTASLERWFSTRRAERERFLRAAIEPQFPAMNDHVTGLHPILRADDPHSLLPMLAVEWLRRFPYMALSAEEELVSFLIRRARWDDLATLLRERLADVELAASRRTAWLSVAFFADFEANAAALDAAALSDPNLFWAIKERGWPKANTGHSVRGLAWLVRTFRKQFPTTYHPSGSSTGNRNGWDATETIHSMIRRLASDTSDEAVEALARLRDETNDEYQPFIQNAYAQQQKARRETGFQPHSLEAVKAVLANNGPLTIADLQQVTMDALDRIQERMGRDDVNQLTMFHGPTGPLGEEACRNSLIILLRDIIGHGIEVIPERQMPAEKRADIVIASGILQLPIEAKGQWHRELWNAAVTQLDTFYAIEWRARGAGLYLVFWFGNDVEPARKLRSRGRGTTRCDTPEQLQKALVAEIPEHRRDAIKVIVLDVSKGPRCSIP